MLLLNLILCPFVADGDGYQDHLLPACLDSACQRSAIYLAKPGSQEVNNSHKSYEGFSKTIYIYIYIYTSLFYELVFDTLFFSWRLHCSLFLLISFDLYNTAPLSFFSQIRTRTVVLLNCCHCYLWQALYRFSTWCTVKSSADKNWKKVLIQYLTKALKTLHVAPAFITLNWSEVFVKPKNTTSIFSLLSFSLKYLFYTGKSHTELGKWGSGESEMCTCPLQVWTALMLKHCGKNSCHNYHSF